MAGMKSIVEWHFTTDDMCQDILWIKTKNWFTCITFLHWIAFRENIGQGYLNRAAAWDPLATQTIEKLIKP